MSPRWRNTIDTTVGLLVLLVMAFNIGRHWDDPRPYHYDPTAVQFGKVMVLSGEWSECQAIPVEHHPDLNTMASAWHKACHPWHWDSATTSIPVVPLIERDFGTEPKHPK